MTDHDLLLPRGRHLSKVQVRHSDPAPDDAYAPAPCGCKCRDRAGRMRPRHEWDRDERCIWCGTRSRVVRP